MNQQALIKHAKQVTGFNDMALATWTHSSIKRIQSYQYTKFKLDGTVQVNYREMPKQFAEYLQLKIDKALNGEY